MGCLWLRVQKLFCLRIAVNDELQTPFTAKHPVVMLKPTLEVEVADPEIERPERVVVPKPVEEIDSDGVVVVENVVGEDVPIYSVPNEFLRVKIGSVVEPVASASCGAVDVARVINHLGVEVPNPV